MTLRLLSAATVVAAVAVSAEAQDDWLTWSSQQAERTAKSTIARGRVAGGRRLLNTERARSYKLTATWFTPDVVRATARTIQISKRLSDEEAVALMAAAERPNTTVIMIELDPDEGSGVIPLNWEAFLQPRNAADRAVRGTKAPQMRDIIALAGVSPRNYDYDRFWMTFPLSRDSGEPLFNTTDREAELSVRIYDREGSVHWPIPAAVVRR